MSGLWIAAAQAIFVTLFRGPGAGPLVVVISGVYPAGIVAAYLLFTLRPLAEPDVFVDPTTHRYGLEAHAVMADDASGGEPTA